MHCFLKILYLKFDINFQIFVFVKNALLAVEKSYNMSYNKEYNFKAAQSVNIL